METSELLKKVKKIEIKTKGLTNQVFTGSYHSAFKGRGMSFSEVRSYTYGDDVRSIDWNVTARFNEPFVKIFEEERELTVMLLIDISKSSYFGTQTQFKNEFMAEIAAVLAFSAIQNNDKVGVLFFSNKVEKYIPPKKGKKHVLLIIRELLNIKPSNQSTDIGMALEYFNNLVKRRSIAFILSDFKTAPYANALRILRKKHDIIGLHIFDKMEKELPDLGLVQMQDLESGKQVWVDSASRNLRKEYTDHFEENRLQNEQSFYRLKADFLSLDTSDNYISVMMQMFKRRGQRR
jgi:uncharacterized protein (DUF58 family)